MKNEFAELSFTVVFLLSIAGQAYALESNKDRWMIAAQGVGGVPAVDAYVERCRGERNPAYRAFVESITSDQLSPTDQKDVLAQYDAAYRTQQHFLENITNLNCSETALANRHTGTGILMAAMLGHPEFKTALDKRRDEIQQDVARKMRSESSKTRTMRFNIRHESKAGYSTVAYMDALTNVCDDSRDPSYREGVSNLWLPKRSSGEHTVAEKKLAEFMERYDTVYEKRLTMLSSHSELFCSDEAVKDLRIWAGHWTKASGLLSLEPAIQEAKAFSSTLDDEAWLTYAQCMSRDILSATQDCRCVAKRIMGARAAGDLRPAGVVWNNIKSQCPGFSWNVYDYQFSRCTVMKNPVRNLDCACSARAFVDLFSKTPTSLMNYLSSMGEKALAQCSAN